MKPRSLQSTLKTVTLSDWSLLDIASQHIIHTFCGVSAEEYCHGGENQRKYVQKLIHLCFFNKRLNSMTRILKRQCVKCKRIFIRIKIFNMQFLLDAHYSTFFDYIISIGFLNSCCTFSSFCFCQQSFLFPFFFPYFPQNAWSD